MTEGFLKFYNQIDELKKVYLFKEELYDNKKIIYLNNGLEEIKLEFSIIHKDAYLNNIIDSINNLTNKNIRKMY